MSRDAGKIVVRAIRPIRVKIKAICLTHGFSIYFAQTVLYNAAPKVAIPAYPNPMYSARTSISSLVLFVAVTLTPSTLKSLLSAPRQTKATPRIDKNAEMNWIPFLRLFFESQTAARQIKLRIKQNSGSRASTVAAFVFGIYSSDLTNNVFVPVYNMNKQITFSNKLYGINFARIQRNSTYAYRWLYSGLNLF